jgi:hypothetical protein
MIEKFDSALGRFICSRHMVTVEPVFANIRNGARSIYTQRQVTGWCPVETLFHGA